MTTEQRTFAVLVDNEPGVLARVVGLFAGRGYNISSLTVTEVDHAQGLSRITLETSGTPVVLEHVKNLLHRLVPVHSVADLTSFGPSVRRELALIKVSGVDKQRVESLRIADIFKAEVVDAGLEHFIFQINGEPEEIDRFVELMRQLGMVDISRTGVAAISRGAEVVLKLPS
jgi:acetolactate synthase-1/3 small subunit